MSDGSKLAGLIILATLLTAAWMFRYKNYGPIHENRITGATCAIYEECWFSSAHY